MGMREKLIELLITAKDLTTLSRKADFLLANDVVPVVRCKDCKHYMTIYCTCDGCCISDDWYCADGERKDND